MTTTEPEEGTLIIYHNHHHPEIVGAKRLLACWLLCVPKAVDGVRSGSRVVATAAASVALEVCLLFLLGQTLRGRSIARSVRVVVLAVERSYVSGNRGLFRRCCCCCDLKWWVILTSSSPRKIYILCPTGKIREHQVKEESRKRAQKKRPRHGRSSDLPSVESWERGSCGRIDFFGRRAERFSHTWSCLVLLPNVPGSFQTMCWCVHSNYKELTYFDIFLCK